MARIAQWLDRQDINVVVANISIDPNQLLEQRGQFRDYFEVFIDVPVKILARRDAKNLYEPALRGEKLEVVGVDIPYPGPSQPDLVIDNASFATAPDELAQQIAESAGIDL
jgi:adenylylsulfate kinase-like enzyme